MAASTERRPLVPYFLPSVSTGHIHFFLVTIVQFDLLPLSCQTCALNMISIDCNCLEVCLDVGEKKMWKGTEVGLLS